MSIASLTVVLILSVFLIFVLGLPVAFSLSGVAMIYASLLWGTDALGIIFYAAFGTMTNFVIVAIPLFILMGFILQNSGVADRVYDLMHKWMGSVNGGLAIGTVWICTLMAAMVGVAGPAIITMSVLSFPAMMSRKYDRRIAIGSIMAGGTLGILIPPSIPMILYASVTSLSVGKMFAAAIVPGLILSFLYTVYIGIRCARNWKLGPALPLEERASWREKVIALRGTVLPILLILGVLGSIFLGIATPTEAAAVGVAGAVICALAHRRFSWSMIKSACYDTVRLSGMVMWILIGAACFSRFYFGMGAADLVKGAIMTAGLNRWVVLILMELSLVVLGMILEGFAIVLIAGPIYGPVIISMGFNPLWFGILFMLHLQVALLTPPYGFALFYMKGALYDKHVPISAIWRSALPFIPIQLLVIVLVMVFPELSLWLPNLLLD